MQALTSVPRASVRALAAFFRWWAQDLLSLVPTHLGQSARPERRGLILELRQTESALLNRTAAGECLLGTVQVDASDYHQRLKLLVHRAKSHTKTITVRLPQDRGLRKRLDLPLAALHDLTQLLGFDMDKLTPFKSDEVHFGHRVLGIDREARRVSIELHVAPRCEVDRALWITRHLGIAATRIQLASTTDEGLNHVNLYFEQSRRSTWEKAVHWTLVTLASVLVVAVVAIPLQRKLVAAAALEAQLSTLRTEAAKSIALQKLLDQLSARVQFLETATRGRVTATQVIAEMTQLLPDQAHLLQFSLRDSTVQLHGIAADANSLITLLDNSAILANPRFLAPVTKDARSGLEAFDISIEITNKKHN